MREPSSGFLGRPNNPHPFYGLLIWVVIKHKDTKDTKLLGQLQAQGFEFKKQAQDGLVIDALPGGASGDDPVANDAICHSGLQTALNRIHPDQQNKIVNLIIKLYRDEADTGKVGICRKFNNSHKIALSHGPELAGKDLYPS